MEQRKPLKKFAMPTAWGGLFLIALLVGLAVAVLVGGAEIERQAELIELDSVPGLIDGHTIRSAYSEGFICAIQAASEENPERRRALLQRLDDLDKTAKGACDDYQRT